MKSNMFLSLEYEGETLASLCKSLITQIGEDPKRGGLSDTPERFSRSMKFLTSGYQESIGDIVGRAVFPETSSGVVLVQDIEFYSLCEHHILPFFGRAHVAYLPDKKVIGLSKIPRIVEIYARRLQVQERLTAQVALGIQEVLSPKGVLVILEASHLCMMMRGIQKQQSRTVTQFHTGIFETDKARRDEVRGLLGLNSGSPL